MANAANETGASGADSLVSCVNDNLQVVKDYTLLEGLSFGNEVVCLYFISLTAICKTKNNNKHTV